MLEEKKVFDLSLAFERSGISGAARKWSLPGNILVLVCPKLLLNHDEAPAEPVTVNTLPCSANLLHVSVEHIKRGSEGMHVLFASTADRRLHLLDRDNDFTLLESLNDVHDSPILSCTTLDAQCSITITTSMSGQVVLYDHALKRVLDERRDHKKYVVKAARFQHKSSTWVATAGWDAMIFLYQLRGEVLCGTCSLGDPVASVSLATNPETVTFLTHPESDLLHASRHQEGLDISPLLLLLGSKCCFDNAYR